VSLRLWARLHLDHRTLRKRDALLLWRRRFILANGKRRPRELGPAEVEAFLSGLATEGNVAAATQNQALSAWLYLHREVLGIELPWLDRVVRQLGGLQRTLIFTYEAGPCGYAIYRHLLAQGHACQVVASSTPPPSLPRSATSNASLTFRCRAGHDLKRSIPRQRDVPSNRSDRPGDNLAN